MKSNLQKMKFTKVNFVFFHNSTLVIEIKLNIWTFSFIQILIIDEVSINEKNIILD